MVKRLKLSELRVKNAASAPAGQDKEENDVMSGEGSPISQTAGAVPKRKRVRKHVQNEEGKADASNETVSTKKRSVTDTDGSIASKKNKTGEVSTASATAKKVVAAPIKAAAPVVESTDSAAGSGDLCDERTVYIEGLPYTSTDEDIMSFFKTCGQIQSVRLPKWHDSGRLRGYGHVQFTSVESVKMALDLDGCDMNGRYIKVDRPQTPRALSSADKTKTNVVRPAGCRSVFVKNIPYDTTEEEVTETFKVCGPITSVRLAVWGNTKQLKGFGYVDFKREDSAEIAVKKSGILSLKGRPAVIDFETGAPKKSFKRMDGNVWNSDSQFSKKK